MHFHISTLKVTDFKMLRRIELEFPDQAHIFQFTGPMAVGKTTCLQALDILINGAKAVPDEPFRKGTKGFSVEGIIKGQDGRRYRIERTMYDEPGRSGELRTLLYNDVTGQEMHIAVQSMIDDLLSCLPGPRGGRIKLAFDPLEFVAMSNEQQVLLLLQLLGEDPEEAKKLDKADDEARKPISTEIKLLVAEKQGMPAPLEGLPPQPIDEEAIQRRLNAADQANQKQQAVAEKKNKLGAEASRLDAEKQRNQRFIEDQKKTIAEIERNLKLAKDGLKGGEQQQALLEKQHAAAKKDYDAAPEAKYVNVAELAEEMASARRTNAAIQVRTRHQALDERIGERQAEYDKITNRIAARRREREAAVKKAKLPVEGLELDAPGWLGEHQLSGSVRYKGLQLKSLSEGEQLQVTVKILVSLNPELRVIFIKRGESLDEKGFAILQEEAAKHDFQFFVARLDTSKLNGLVFQDGEVVINHYATPKLRKSEEVMKLVATAKKGAKRSERDPQRGRPGPQKV